MNDDNENVLIIAYNLFCTILIPAVIVFKNSGFVGFFAICVKIYGNSLLHIVYLI